MLPLFPFIAGLVVGTAAVSLYRNPKTRDSLKGVGEKLKVKSARAQESLRHAAVAGLDTIDSSSARWRDRLQAASEKPAEAPEPSIDEKEAAPAEGTTPKTRRQAAKPAATKPAPEDS